MAKIINTTENGNTVWRTKGGQEYLNAVQVIQEGMYLELDNKFADLICDTKWETKEQLAEALNKCGITIDVREECHIEDGEMSHIHSFK